MSNAAAGVEEDVHDARLHVQPFARLEVKNVELFASEFDLNRTALSTGELQLDESARRGDGAQGCPETAVSFRAADFEVVGPGVRGGVARTLLPRIVEGQGTEEASACLHAAAEDVHVADEIHDERCGRVLHDRFG